MPAPTTRIGSVVALYILMILVWAFPGGVVLVDVLTQDDPRAGAVPLAWCYTPCAVLLLATLILLRKHPPRLALLSAIIISGGSLLFVGRLGIRLLGGDGPPPAWDDWLVLVVDLLLVAAINALAWSGWGRIRRRAALGTRAG